MAVRRIAAVASAGFTVCLRRAGAERGDSLIEVLVALAVLGLAVTACVQLLLYSLGAQSQVAQREAAGRLLADAAELTQAWPVAWPAAATAEWEADATQLRRGAPMGGEPDVKRLSSAGDSPQRLRVTLNWSAGDRDRIALLLTAYATSLAPP